MIVDEAVGDSLALSRSWSAGATTGHEDNLGLEGLPVDTELEEFVRAMHMTEMDTK
jgi:hypothetical protein